MSEVGRPTAPLRLPVGRVTVLLGPTAARRHVMTELDDATGRCGTGHEAVVRRVRARAVDGVAQRLALLDAARLEGAPIVLVDRLTDGLAAPHRRAVLAGVRAVAAAGPAVLLDDADPVAALAVADGALRTGGAALVEPVGLEPVARAS